MDRRDFWGVAFLVTLALFIGVALGITWEDSAVGNMGCTPSATQQCGK